MVTCGGGWPGQGATDEQLTKAVVEEKIKHPERLGCQVITENVEYGIKVLEEYRNGKILPASGPHRLEA